MDRSYGQSRPKTSYPKSYSSYSTQNSKNLLWNRPPHICSPNRDNWTFVSLAFVLKYPLEASKPGPFGITRRVVRCWVRKCANGRMTVCYNLYNAGFVTSINSTVFPVNYLGATQSCSSIVIQNEQNSLSTNLKSLSSQVFPITSCRGFINNSTKDQKPLITLSLLHGSEFWAHHRVSRDL